MQLVLLCFRLQNKLSQENRTLRLQYTELSEQLAAARGILFSTSYVAVLLVVFVKLCTNCAPQPAARCLLPSLSCVQTLYAFIPSMKHALFYFQKNHNLLAFS